MIHAVWPKDTSSQGFPQTTSSPSKAGYDDGLTGNVRHALRQTGYFPLRKIAIRAGRNGRVRLEGEVPTYFLKQVAQTAALAVAGVAAVDNLLEVAATNFNGG